MRTILKYILVLSLGVLLSYSCTDLNEVLTGNEDVIATDADVLAGITNGMYGDLIDLSNVWYGYMFTSEITAGSSMIPVRGSANDWYDGGKYIKLTKHTWTRDDGFTGGNWGGFSSRYANAQNLLEKIAQVEEDPENLSDALKITYGEGMFFKAFYAYLMLDVYGQVATEDKDENGNNIVLVGAKAADTILGWLETAYTYLPAKGGERYAYGKVSKSTADLLSAKIYLNRVAYDNSPFEGNSTFTDADFKREHMEECIRLCDRVMATGQYSVVDKYFDIFGKNNDKPGKNDEALLVIKYTNTVDLGWPKGRTEMFRLVAHWNTVGPEDVEVTKSGDDWRLKNIRTGLVGYGGMCFLPGYVDNFGTTDEERANDRRFKDENYKSSALYQRSGMYSGINVGPVVYPNYRFPAGHPNAGERIPVYERDGVTPLVYTQEVSTLGDQGVGAGEGDGARGVKYEIDFDGVPFVFNADYVVFRYSDIILMKAEAEFRLGMDGSSTVDELLDKRLFDNPGYNGGLDGILKERACEFWLENHRRQDMIRFGQYSEPNQFRTEKSSVNRRVMCLTNQILATNPNLYQIEY
ncbi:RagB/SusD family nutrient uptake outer membrane protein [Sunxiuqinia sp. sy24]|uniref:RagB/SusD family nutrient uptake outer membrane protein n=1 Tax=Sunxiuqinia sp. sy24 TaxID=3461495 RepID=UPI0040460FEE